MLFLTAQIYNKIFFLQLPFSINWIQLCPILKQEVQSILQKNITFALKLSLTLQC